MVQGGDEPPSSFYMLQYFETILPSVETFWSSEQDEVCFMGGGTAGTMVAILDFVENYKSG